MRRHTDIPAKELRSSIRRKEIVYAGNRRLKIYGRLDCAYGKRMKIENRVFFSDMEDAINQFYRPCGHCMKKEYNLWKMKLFEIPSDINRNLLPYQGTVNYYGKLLSVEKADMYFDRLMQSVEWKNDEAVIFGKRIITKRKVAWYGDRPFEYTYSNITKLALPWTRELLELKNLVESSSGETYNSCLLNLYHNGEESMAWHSDGETDLKKDGAIGSLSFGAERKFAFKHKQTGEKAELILEHGSLLVMKDKTQSYWLHRLPPTKKIKTPRINLTFRTIVN